MRAKRIGVTGGIAEGKTTVVEHIREMGVAVFSADEAAAELWQDPLVQDRISVALSLPVPLDRNVVRARIAEDPAARKKLNAIMHHPVLERLLSSAAPVVEVPLLIEACLQGLFEEIWVVTCGPDEQHERLTRRLNDAALARELIASQLRTDVKAAFADEIIRTDQPICSVQCDVQSLVSARGLA